MKFIFFIILFGLLQLSQPAHACFNEGRWLSDQTLEEALSEAYAIGIFEGKWAGDKQQAVIYKAITRYTDFPDQKIRVELPRDRSMCEPPFPYEGVYELVIVKKGKEFFLSQKTLKPQDWETLREGRNNGFIYKYKKEYCSFTDGIWEIEGRDYPQHICNYYASDSHNICRDSNECEGQCMAFLADKVNASSDEKQAAQKRIAEIQSQGEEYGRCSPLRKQRFCRNVIEDGIYIKDNCVKANKERK